MPRINFELGPETGRKLAAFARKTMLHQPVDYLRAVIVDLAKYVDSAVNPRPYAGQPSETLSFGWRDTTAEQLVVRAMSRGYRGTDVHLHGQQVLGFYQNVFRVSGLSICALALFTVLGVFFFGLSAFAL